jgi:hypothetical protein
VRAREAARKGRPDPPEPCLDEHRRGSPPWLDR